MIQSTLVASLGFAFAADAWIDEARADQQASRTPLMTCVPGPSSRATRKYEISTGPLTIHALDSPAPQTVPGIFIKISDLADPRAIPAAMPPLAWALRSFDLRYDGDNKLVGIQPKRGSEGVCAGTQIGAVFAVDGDDSEVCVALDNRDFMAGYVNTGGAVRGYRCF